MGGPGSHDINYPLPNSAYPGQGASGFLAKFDANGNRLWARYFLDSVILLLHTITVDQSGDVVVSGNASRFFQMPASAGSFQQYPSSPSSNTAMNTFLIKFDGNDGSLDWWTYFDGPEVSKITSVTTDSSNHIYLSGPTWSQGMATPNAPWPSFAGGAGNFLAKFDPGGQQVWFTYLPDSVGVPGGTNQILSDGGAAIYRLTVTSQDGLSTTGSFNPTINGGRDLLISSHDASNGHLDWATYYGTKWDDEPIKMTLNKDKDIILVGRTYFSLSKDLQTECTLDNSDYRHFIAKFLKNGQREWAGYYEIGFDQAPSNYHYNLKWIDVTAGVGNDFYTLASSYGAGLATPGAFYENTAPQATMHLFSKFQDFFACPQRNVQITRRGDTLFVAGGYEQYTWYRDNIAVNTGVDSFLVLTQGEAASYHVRVEDGCGCSYDSGIFAVTGLKSMETLASLEVAPNPSRGTVRLVGRLPQEATALVYTISDISGRVLQKGTVRAESQTSSSEIDCGNLAKGLYFIEIKSKDAKKVIKLIVEG